MSRHSIILITLSILVAAYSCKLIKNSDTEKYYDYKIGDTIALSADSTIILNTGTNYYTIWFCGPVNDKRRVAEKCSSPYRGQITFAKSSFKIWDEFNDTLDFKLDVIGCLKSGSTEHVINLGIDSLVFVVDSLTPYPSQENIEIDFNEYNIKFRVIEERVSPKIVGKYEGIFVFDENESDVDFIFTDSTYFCFSNKANFLPLSFGTFHQTEERAFFYNKSLSTTSNWSLIPRGFYYYNYKNDTLKLWSGDKTATTHYSLAKKSYQVIEKLNSIEYGIKCGWCSLDQRVLITQKRTIFYSDHDCGGIRPDTVLSTSPELWDEINSLLDLNVFLNIDFYGGSLVADGCNQWILAKNDTADHAVVFDHIDQEEVKSIKPIIELLTEVNEQYVE